jgi:hypothetical protein
MVRGIDGVAIFRDDQEDKGSALDIGQDAQVGFRGRIIREKAYGTAFAH